jgi:hypothetical protein
MLVQDVADLCVAALSHPGARNTTLGCTTLDPLSTALYWTGSTWAPIYPRDISPLVVSGPQWSPLLDRIGQPDTTPLEEKPHVLAVRVAVVVALVAVSVFIAAVALGLLSVWQILGFVAEYGLILGFVAWLFASLNATIVLTEYVKPHKMFKGRGRTSLQAGERGGLLTASVEVSTKASSHSHDMLQAGVKQKL